MKRLLCAAIAIVGVGAVTFAGPVFPPVGVLQDQINLHPGDMLPKLVVFQDHTFHPRYVGARALPNGRYMIEMQLER